MPKRKLILRIGKVTANGGEYKCWDLDDPNFHEFNPALYTDNVGKYGSTVRRAVLIGNSMRERLLDEEDEFFMWKRAFRELPTIIIIEVYFDIKFGMS